MAIERTETGRYRVRLNFRGQRATKTLDDKDDARQWEVDQKRLIKSGHYARTDTILHTSSTIAKPPLTMNEILTPTKKQIGWNWLDKRMEIHHI